jgi:hypothetical protein
VLLAGAVAFMPAEHRLDRADRLWRQVPECHSESFRESRPPPPMTARIITEPWAVSQSFLWVGSIAPQAGPPRFATSESVWPIESRRWASVVGPLRAKSWKTDGSAGPYGTGAQSQKPNPRLRRHSTFPYDPLPALWHRPGASGVAVVQSRQRLRVRWRPTGDASQSWRPRRVAPTASTARSASARVCLTALVCWVQAIWVSRHESSPRPRRARDGRKCHAPPPSDPPATAALNRDRRAPGQPSRPGTGAWRLGRQRQLGAVVARQPRNGPAWPPPPNPLRGLPDDSA